LIAAALASGVFLAWQTAGALLMIFGGLLLAALLDAATRGLLHILPLGRGACFAIVCTLFVGLILVGITWGGYTIVQEWDALHRVLTSQLKNIGNRLADMRVQTPGPRGGRVTDEQIASILLPDPAGLLVARERRSAPRAMSSSRSSSASLLVSILPPIGVGWRAYCLTSVAMLYSKLSMKWPIRSGGGSSAK
jgi:predicted PurR-regulated permease PerM